MDKEGDTRTAAEVVPISPSTSPMESSLPKESVSLGDPARRLGKAKIKDQVFREYEPAATERSPSPSQSYGPV